MYPILNYSRKTYIRCLSRFGQTGEGHYSPISGYHRGEDSTLIMDVARFKYPSHWMDIPTIYESLKEIDTQSGLTRGLVILSKHPKLFSDLCRIGVDCSLLAKFSKLRKSKRYEDLLQKLRQTTDPREKTLCFLEFTKSLDAELTDVLTLYTISMSFHLDSEDKTGPYQMSVGESSEGFITLMSQSEVLQGLVDAHLRELAAVKFSRDDFVQFPFLDLLRDYQPQAWNQLLALLIHTFESDRAQKSPSLLSPIQKELLNNSQKYLFI